VQELKPGLWWWEAEHPEWASEDAATEDWGPEVSSYAIDDGTRLLLIDPTAPPEPVEDLAAGREVVIVLTCPWHQRDTRNLIERLGATLHMPPPDGGDPDPLPGQVFRAGERLPIGVETRPGMEPNDLVLRWNARCPSLGAPAGVSNEPGSPDRFPGHAGPRRSSGRQALSRA
jgi:hypothetical protein